MPFTFNEKSPKVPTDERSLGRLRQHIQLGDLDDLTLVPFLPLVPRYLVTYINSQTGVTNRSATVVTVTNQSGASTEVSVAWFRGFSTIPSGTSTMVIPAGFTVDFGSRSLPGDLTVVNSVPNPELTFDEGRAVVSSRNARIGVSARVYYTTGDDDSRLSAITDSKVVVYGAGNTGD